MKKVIILLCLLMFSILPTWAEYKPIPKELSKQYKYEVEKYINNQYPIAIKEVKQIESEAKRKYKLVMHNPKDLQIYMDFATNNFDIIIDNPLFYMYVDIIKITEKYVSTIKEDIPATDFTGSLSAFLYPYFKDNNVNTSKMIKIGKYEYKKYKIIEKYIKQADKLRPNWF